MPTAHRARLAWISCTLCLVGCAAMPEDGISVTPQRPTFSSDTGTTARGTFELETGVAIDPGASASVPTSVKFGIDDATEVNVGFSPYDAVEAPGTFASGFSDTVVGARHRFWESDQGTSAALQLGVKLPSGTRSGGLSSGEVDVGTAGILTHVLDERTTLTGYYEYTALGDPVRSGMRSQHTFAVAASHSLPGHIGVYGELARVIGQDMAEPFVATVGLTRTLHPSVALDIGVGFGLNHDAPDALLLAGITINLGRAGR